MSDFNAETELKFEKRQAHRANKRNQSQNTYPRIDVRGLSSPPRPPSWHHPLTCSFSEYGLLRTTGMLPFPHRSLKTRSFSTPRGRGLCDLPSRSLKGKARGGEESVASGGTSWCPWSGNPESVHNLHHSPARLYVEPASFGCPACCFGGSSATGGKVGPLSNTKVGSSKLALRAGPHPSLWTSFQDGHDMDFRRSRDTGGPSPSRTHGQGNGHQTSWCKK